MAVSIRFAYSKEIAALCTCRFGKVTTRARFTGPLLLPCYAPCTTSAGAGNQIYIHYSAFPTDRPLSSGDDRSPRRTRSSREMHNIVPASYRDREVFVSVADLRVARILQLAGNRLYDGFFKGLATQILDYGAAKGSPRILR